MNTAKRIRDVFIRRFLLVPACCILSGGSFAATTEMTNSLPSYLVKFSGESVRADGKLDESAWATAPWSSDFVWIDAGDRAPLHSRFKAIYNKEGLHLAFEYEAKRAAGEPLDPDFPYACEIFLDPEGRGRRYLEYAAAPDGSEHVVTWNGRLSMREWKGEPGVTSQLGVSTTPLNPARETVIYEVSFPWSGMAKLTGRRHLPPAKGEAWRANFSRVEAAEFQGDYAWSPMGGIYYMHNPGAFGWLVFAGDKDPLREVPNATLKPLEDDTFKIDGSGRFPLFSRSLWAKWLIPVASDGGFYPVSKSYMTRLDAKGRTQWTITRTEGLPQFIRSLASVGGELYLAGNGIAAGLVTVDDGGRVNRVARQEGYALDVSAAVFPLSAERALAASGDHFQIIEPKQILVPVQAGGKILCATMLKEGRLAIGTPNGFELYDASGKFIQRADIAGGITAVTSLGDAAIGVSGKNGLYRMSADGACGYYPRPLRTKFDGIYADSHGRCWATYLGGLALIDKDEMRTFNEPLGLTGFQIYAAASAADGTMAFAGAIPNGSWYGSTQNSPFLLVTDGRRWWKYSFREGLPAQLNTVTSIGGEVFLCTNAGVFKFRK